MSKTRLQKTTSDLKDIYRSITENTIKYNLLVEKKNGLLDDLKILKERETVLAETCRLLQEATTFSRKRLKECIETTVTSALRDIIGDNTIGFEIKYEVSHNKTVADFYMTKVIDDETVYLDIMNECGGGIADIVSIAIRIVLLTYHSSTLSKILLLDEACTSISNFSQELLSNLAKWLKSVSDRFDIQIILITQKEEFIQHSDKVFVVRNDNGYSTIADTRTNV